MTDNESEPFITRDDMQRRFQGGPRLGKSAVLALLDGRMYKQEADGWHRLSDKPHRSVRDLADSNGSP